MNRLKAYILLTVFSGFITSISLDFQSYLEILNAGADVEDINSMPEEHSEKSINDNKVNQQLRVNGVNLLTCSNCDAQYFDHHQFSVQENIYFDVPYSPPELA